MILLGTVSLLKTTTHDTKLLYCTSHWIPTPPQLPDISPTENLWHNIEDINRTHKISNKNHFKKSLLDEWKIIYKI